jgi:hypothetical protein
MANHFRAFSLRRFTAHGVALMKLTTNPCPPLPKALNLRIFNVTGPIAAVTRGVKASSIVFMEYSAFRQKGFGD